MRVLIIAQYFPPDMGGGATRAFNAAKGLKANGCDVVVVAAFPHYPTGNIPKEYRWRIVRVEHVDGIKVIRTFVPPLASRGLANRMVLFLSFIVSSLLALPFVGRIDVVWAANPNILSIFPALVFGLLKRCPVALNVDDLWPEDVHLIGLLKKDSITFKIAELLAKIAYNKASLVTPISPGYVRVISGKYGVSPRKIRVIMGGVDLSKFKPTYGKPTEENHFIVLYSGAFSIAYDFDQVLKAAKLLENYEDIKFILQGGGELVDYVKRRIEKLKIRNVKVIDKIISREEVARLLNEADTVILPLKNFGKPYLGISTKLYEYQAVAKPIICCCEGQPADYVKETKSGIVIKPGDYKSLAKAIIYLKQNPEIARRMGLSGRCYVEANLTIDKIGFQMKKAFEILKHE
ncbi:MAG: glycosyltransferase family 4 protein [Candidatus Jordarchaeales archaeon]